MRQTGNLESPYTNRTPFQRVRLYCAAGPFLVPVSHPPVKTMCLSAFRFPVDFPGGTHSAGKAKLSGVRSAFQ